MYEKHELTSDDVLDIVADATDEQVLEARCSHFDLEYFTLIDRKKVHAMADIPTAYTDGTYLLFKNQRAERRNRFLYYIGAENEAELVWHDGTYTIYENVEGRISRLHDETAEKLNAE